MSDFCVHYFYKLKVILPIAEDAAQQFMPGVIEEVEAALTADFTADYEALPNEATDFIQSRTSEEWNAPYIIDIANRAADEGFDGVFISCFGEPAVEVLKEQIDIPVVGGFAPAINQAMMVSAKFSVVTVVESVVPMLWSLAHAQNVAGLLTSIRQIGIPVSDLTDLEKLKKHLLEESIKAIEDDGAEAIVLGCTGLLKVTQWLTESLRIYFRRYVPVVAPTGAAISSLEGMAKNNLRPSRFTYFRPTEQYPVAKVNNKVNDR